MHSKHFPSPSRNSKKIYMFFLLLCEQICHLTDKSVIFLLNISDNISTVQRKMSVVFEIRI